MFDKFGQPNGYGQGGPFHDPAAPAGQGSQPKQQPLQQAIGPAQYPADPGLTAWRSATKPQPFNPQSTSAGPNGAANNFGAMTGLGGQVTNGINPINGQPLGPNEGASISGPFSFGLNSNTSHPVATPPPHLQAPPPSGATAPPAAGGLGPITDPNQWLSLVGNDEQLTNFVSQGLGKNSSIPGRVDYYKKVIKGQPGANAQEQAGSADYYNKMMAGDPVSGVKSGTGPARRFSPLMSAINGSGSTASIGQPDEQHQYLQQLLQNLQA